MSHSVKVYDTCIGCTQCVRACPCDVLEMVAWTDVSLVKLHQLLEQKIVLGANVVKQLVQLTSYQFVYILVVKLQEVWVLLTKGTRKNPLDSYL